MKNSIVILFLFFSNALFSQTVHFKFVSRTGVDASIIAIPYEINPNVNGVKLVSGDEVGVFNQSNACYGAVIWMEKSTTVVAWGDVPETTIKDGFSAGEVIYFRIWVKKSNKEYHARPKYKSGQGLTTGLWASNGLMMLDSLTGYQLVGIENTKTQPEKLALFQNYPNPFNPETKINFELNSSGYVKLEVFDLTGKNVSVLFDGYKAAGKYTLIWDGKNVGGNLLSSGIYFYKLSFQSNFSEVKKMLMMR